MRASHVRVAAKGGVELPASDLAIAHALPRLAVIRPRKGAAFYQEQDFQFGKYIVRVYL